MDEQVMQGWLTRTTMFKKLALGLAKDFVNELLKPENVKPKLDEWKGKISKLLEAYPVALKAWQEVDKEVTSEELAELIQKLATTIISSFEL